MVLALFDLDNTLLSGDSDYAWGEFLCAQQAVDATEYRQKNAYFMRQYDAGKLNMEQFLQFATKPFVTIPQKKLLQLQQDFMQQIIQPMILPRAEQLIAKHKEKKHHLMIITATNDFIAAPIAKQLGIKDLIATELEKIDGDYSGKIVGEPAFQAGKVNKLNQWLKDQPYSLDKAYFYSDSHNDLPLLESVAHPVVVDGDAKLLQVAQEKAWKVLSLR